MNQPDAIWLDMQLPPGLCGWVSTRIELPCEHFSRLDMERTPDEDAFRAARDANAVVFTKDTDFAQLVQRHGSPPSVLWLRCGNCSVAALRELLDRVLQPAIDLIRSGEPLVEIADLPPMRPEEA